MNKRLVNLAIAIAFIAALSIPYVALVLEGKIPPPDLAAVARSVSNTIGVVIEGGTTTAVALSFVIVAFLAAIAPIVFALRSTDIITILISFVLVTVTWFIVFNSRTSIDLALAGIVYLSSMTLSSVVFAAERINPRHSQEMTDMPKMDRPKVL